MIFYEIIVITTGECFPVQIKNKRTAEKFCQHLSNRDNRIDYKVVEMFCEIGIPDYRDEEIELALNII